MFVNVIAAVVLLGMVTGNRGAQRPLDVYLGDGGGIVIVVRMTIGWLGFVDVVTMMIGMMIHIHSSWCLFPFGILPVYPFILPYRLSERMRLSIQQVVRIFTSSLLFPSVYSRCLFL